MIRCIVTVDGVPAIEVEAGGQRWQAIIDTGFNGELAGEYMPVNAMRTPPAE